MPITRTASRSEAVAISRTLKIASGVSIIAQSRVWSGAPAHSSAVTSPRTWSAVSTLGTTIASGPAWAAATMSAECHSVLIPLMRIVSSRAPYSPDAAAAHAASRAAGLASGATASSRSRIRPSQGIDFAFSRARSLDDGM